MDATKEVLQGKRSAVDGELYMALELGVTKWKMALSSDGIKVRTHELEAGDRLRLLQLVEQTKQRLRLAPSTKVMCCYEAGRDGFWLHRWLVEAGIENVVVDSSSIDVKRRHRRAKTDRLDAHKLAMMLVRHCRGERQVWQVLRVPTRVEEEARRTHREQERLQREHTSHANRISALLALHGIRAQHIGGRGWDERLAQYALRVGIHEAAELVRETARLKLVKEQLRALEAEQRELLNSGQGVQILRLARLCGIGAKSAWILFYEFFWRRFNNRREVGSCAGLTGTPYQSGESCREQGISKAGNKRVRRLMVELAWGWLRYQPQSALSVWFSNRFAGAGVRLRRIGIVALARRLLIAIWHYLEHGVVPQGARVKLV
jgi:transposase